MDIERKAKITTGIIGSIILGGAIYSGVRQISNDECSELSVAEKVKGNKAYELCLELDELTVSLGIGTIVLSSVLIGGVVYKIFKDD